jgi:CheY-like chemotaxis protein
MPESSVILLAEDEEDYVLLIKKAFAETQLPIVVQVVSDGREAMWYLDGVGKYSNREEYPLPDLFLLDLKLPRYNGFEVLSWLRKQPGFATLRVLVLTSSDRVKDVNEAYRLGANSFLVKPYDFSDLAHLSALIHDFWLDASRSPESFRPPKKGSPDEPNGSKKEG